MVRSDPWNGYCSFCSFVRCSPSSSCSGHSGLTARTKRQDGPRNDAVKVPKERWARLESNQRLRGCEPRVLTAELRALATYLTRDRVGAREWPEAEGDAHVEKGAADASVVGRELLQLQDVSVCQANRQLWSSADRCAVAEVPAGGEDHGVSIVDAKRPWKRGTMVSRSILRSRSSASSTSARFTREPSCPVRRSD